MPSGETPSEQVASWSTSLSKPQATFLEDVYRFEWAEEQVALVFERFAEQRGGGLRCELIVTTSRPPNAGLLFQGLCNLLTSNGQLIRKLETRMPGLDWDGLLTQAAAITLRRYREGSPLVDLATEPTEVPSRYLLPPFVARDGATVWAADGGTGKSVLALAAALSVASALPLLNAYPHQVGPVLYLDWEADEETHRERLWALWRELDTGVPPPLESIHYVYQTASLHELATTLRRRVAETGAVLVVIDSLGLARGGAPEDAEATIRTFRAIRSLGVPALCIDHVSKAQREGHVKRKTAIGSIYTRNSARLVWVVEKAQQEGAADSTVAFTVDKFNFGKLPRRRGFRLHFESERAGKGEGNGNTNGNGNGEDDERLISIAIEPAADPQVHQIAGGNERKWEIASVLKAAPSPLTAEEVASSIGVSTNRARNVLTDHEGSFFTRVGGGRPVRWALLAEEPAPA